MHIVCPGGQVFLGSHHELHSGLEAEIYVQIMGSLVSGLREYLWNPLVRALWSIWITGAQQDKYSDSVQDDFIQDTVPFSAN